MDKETLENMFNEMVKVQLDIIEKDPNDIPEPTLYLLDSDLNVYYIHPTRGKGPMERRKEVAKKKMKSLLILKKIVAVISISYGYAIHLSKLVRGSRIKDMPGSTEGLMMWIDSVLFKKTLQWNIKRNGNGEIVVPLETPRTLMEAPLLRFVGDYFQRC